MVHRECSIKDFRDIVATAADVMNMKKDYFNLVIEVNGNPEILDAYALETFDGKEWIRLHRGHDLCEIVDLLKDAIKIGFEKGSLRHNI